MQIVGEVITSRRARRAGRAGRAGRAERAEELESWQSWKSWSSWRATNSNSIMIQMGKYMFVCALHEIYLPSWFGWKGDEMCSLSGF